jgi:hypothetical protein
MKFSYHPDDSVTAYSHFALTESALKDLVDVLFVMNWSQITVGPCIEGGSFRSSAWSSHLRQFPDSGFGCVAFLSMYWATQLGTSSEELRRVRPVSKIAFFERRGEGCAGS